MLGLEATYNIFQSPSLSASLSLMLPKSEGQMNCVCFQFLRPSLLKNLIKENKTLTEVDTG